MKFKRLGEGDEPKVVETRLSLSDEAMETLMIIYDQINVNTGNKIMLSLWKEITDELTNKYPDLTSP